MERFGYYSIHSEYLELVKEHAKIIGDIFDEKNKNVCSNCSSNLPPKVFKYRYIDKLGKKVRQRYEDFLYPVNKKKISGCCSGCFGSNGFFRTDSIYHEPHVLLEKLKKVYGFNSPYGFFDPEKMSCGLPREFRSCTCLSHYCEQLNLSSEEIKQIRKSSKIMLLAKYYCKFIY